MWGFLARDEQVREAERDGRGEQAAEASARREAASRRLADLREQYAALEAEEAKLTRASQRLQEKIDAFRTRKEAVKATWRAEEAAAGIARAEKLIDDAMAGAGGAAMELKELRPGAPSEIAARILFTVEEDGTAVLLAAGTPDDWLRAWHTEAAAAARSRYRRG